MKQARYTTKCPKCDGPDSAIRWKDTVMNNADQLKQIKLDSGKTWPQISKLTGYSIHTLNAWTAPDTAKKHRSLHDRDLERIKLKVRANV